MTRGQGSGPFLGSMFDPAGQQWHELTPQQSVTQFESGLQRDSVLEFLHNHPNLIKLFFQRANEMINTIFDWKLFESGVIESHLYLNQYLQKQNESDLNRVKELSKIENKLNDAKVRGQIPRVRSPDGRTQTPQMAYEQLDLDSEAFFQLLSEDQIMDVKAKHEANHHYAVEQGFAHANHEDPAQATAFNTPWGVSHGSDPRGQFHFQPHTQDPYSMQHYPGQPPGMMRNPHGYRGGLMGSLVAAGAGKLLMV